MISSKHPENFFPKAHLSKTHLPILIGKSPARPYSGLPDLKGAYRVSGEGLCQGCSDRARSASGVGLQGVGLYGLNPLVIL